MSDHGPRLRIGVPKKGRIAEKVAELLKGCDIRYTKPARLDIATAKNLPIELVFLPAADIAMYVADGCVDLGITGQDIIRETGLPVKEEVTLDIGACRLCVQWPVKNGFSNVKDLLGKRCVTSFPKITKEYFDELAGNAEHGTDIKVLHGSVEASVGMGLAECVVDLVETGDTMRAAGLDVASTIMDSQAVMISNPNSIHQEMIAYLKKRVVGYLTATKFYYMVYNVHKDNIVAAEKVTPGKRSPTVSTLEDPSWKSVSVLVKRSEVQLIMDKLETIGATDILVWDVRNTRGFE
uniref:ATP phosphoribosyltransferase n=2 Tax=Eutreptiella gymnastica TaxID=73025 RepID=A0A7S1J0M6_9EUGL